MWLCQISLWDKSLVWPIVLEGRAAVPSVSFVIATNSTGVGKCCQSAHTREKSASIFFVKPALFGITWYCIMCSMFFMVLSCIFAVFCVYFLWVCFCVFVVYVCWWCFCCPTVQGPTLPSYSLSLQRWPRPHQLEQWLEKQAGGEGGEKVEKKLFKKLIRAAATLPILWSFIWVLKMIKWKKFMEDISNFPPHPNPEGTGAFYGRGVILDKVILHQ